MVLLLVSVAMLAISINPGIVIAQENTPEGISTEYLQYLEEHEPVVYNSIMDYNDGDNHFLQNSSEDIYYDDRFYLGGFDGEIRASIVYNDELYVGGFFTSINGNPDIQYIARWDGSDWQQVPIPFVQRVYDMTVYNDTLYIATFQSVYSYDGNTVQQIGGSFNQGVFAIGVYNGDIVVGGVFTANFTSPGTYNRIARWNGSDWVPIGDGFDNNWVEALIEFEGELYAGGTYTVSGGNIVNRIARWDGEAWQQVGSGFDNNFVMDLAIFNNELYASGSFSQSGGEPMNRVARLVDGEWEQPGDGFNGTVASLGVIDSTLYAGGSFTGSGTTPLRKAAMLVNEQWQSVSNEVSLLDGTTTNIRSIIEFDGTPLIAGGFFSEETVLRNIAILEDTGWEQFGTYVSGGLGLGGGVQSYLIYDDMLVTGGSFTLAGDKNISRIAMFNNEEWLPLGDGFNSTINDVIEYNGDLIAGGAFSSPAFRVGKWDGAEWNALGSGFNTSVLSLYAYDGDLYAGGFFTTSGATAVNRIARWDGSNWHPLGAGFDSGDVRVFVEYDGDLFVGGTFTASDGLQLNRIARWDGDQLHPVGNGFNNSVFALIVFNGELIAGGAFTNSDGTPVNYIARWNGESWEPFGNGLNSWVYALMEFDGELVAGGVFTQAGGQQVNRLARLSDNVWQPLGSGVSSSVTSFIEYQQALFIGGGFTAAGGIGSSRIARWYDPPRIPTPVYPPDDTTGVNTTVELAWDIINRAHNYHLQIAGDAEFTDIFLNTDTLTSASYTVDNVPHSTQLFWRVSSINDVGMYGWSPVYTFATGIPVPAPAHPSPAEDGISLHPTLAWNAIPDVIHYNLQYSQDENFASAVISYNELSDTSLTISNLSFGTTYYWRVNATTGMGDGDWSPVASFTTIESLPLKVELDAPVTADSLIVNIHDIQVLLSWFTGTPHVQYYEIEIADDAGFTSLIVSDSTLADTAYVFTDAEDRETYWWRVRGKNVAGWGEYSDVRSFSTTLTNVTAGVELPEEFVLMQNYPNPFNPSTVIRYGIPEQSYVRLEIFNLLGQRVALLIDDILDASYYETTWHANRASGMYFYRLEAVPLTDSSNPFVKINSMLLVK